MTNTPARNAQTAALEALIEAHAIELKLRPSGAGSRPWPPKRSASSRPRSRTSARCSRPRCQNAPSGARNAA